jgi:hypothetical protein
MYRSNYASKEKDPMVYIVSHTWPNRWMKPGIKDSIIVYSNCDEVELFNDIDNASLGKRRRSGIGTHFQWDKVNIQYNILYAVGYVNGKAVARDTIVLFHLPQSPNFNKLYSAAKNMTKPEPGYNYIYRINCGGAEYEDENSSIWSADESLKLRPEIGSNSWTDDFTGMSSFFASQRRTFSPIKGTKDWKLFQAFRYGKSKLKYEFKLPDGEYLVELYFIEPWLGIGGGVNGKDMRLFDVAINDKVILNDIDIWSEVGTNTVLKKKVRVKIQGGKMIISFPESKVGQAVISAIAIATKSTIQKKENEIKDENTSYQSWLDIGDKLYTDDTILINSLPSFLFGAAWIQFRNKSSVDPPMDFRHFKDTYIYVAVRKGSELVKGFENANAEIVTDENAGTVYNVYRKFSPADSILTVQYGAEAIIMLQPVTKMQPAYDLKPITQYRSNVAKVSEGIVKEDFNGRECIVVKTNRQVTVDYPIQTGVADIYSITMKYFYGKQTAIQGKLQLIDARGTMMHEEEVQFNFTQPGKWNQFTINTGNMINAGNYIVRLIIDNAEGLAISSIDIQ